MHAYPSLLPFIAESSHMPASCILPILTRDLQPKRLTVTNLSADRHLVASQSYTDGFQIAS